MRLEATRLQKLIRNDPGDYNIAWSFEIYASADEDAEIDEAEIYETENYEAENVDASSEYLVGRIFADELRRYDIAECGERIWDVADADSSGLEAAWAALLDEDGNFLGDDFEGNADPVVYVYRFVLHPDFARWRMAVMDAFCETFGSDAIILAQHHTTWFSEAEYRRTGFRILPKTKFSAPEGFPNIDRETRFMAHDNTIRNEFTKADYPDESPGSTREHELWVEDQGHWDGLI